MVGLFDFMGFVAVTVRTLLDMTILQTLLDDPDARRLIVSRLKVERSTVHRWHKGSRFPSFKLAIELQGIFPNLRLEDIYISTDETKQGNIT